MHHLDVHALASKARFNGFHRLILLLCMLIIVADGYDIAVMGVALPSIMKDMGVAPTLAGSMASASVFGMMIGAVLIGSLADRVGRRRAIIACLCVFSLGTAACGFIHEPMVFIAVRFIAGLGIGGVMPCVVAQMTEFSPKTSRASMVTAAFSGFSIGGIVAALVGKGLIEAHGWPIVFFAGAFPILLIPFLLHFMPESMAYLVTRGRSDELRGLLLRIDPAVRIAAGDVLVSAADASSKGDERYSQTSRMFREGRALSTSMFWLASFMCLFVIYGLVAWLVKMMANAGYSLGSAITFVLVLNIGALIGSIGSGRLGDRFQIKWVLCTLYVLAAFGIVMLSNKMSEPWLLFFIGLVGASTYGGQTLTFAYAGQFYPINLRSIGVGWTTAIGRVGAVAAPILIGMLMTLKLPLEQNFFAIAMPTVLAAIAVTQIRTLRSDTPPTGLRNAHEPIKHLVR